MLGLNPSRSQASGEELAHQAADLEGLWCTPLFHQRTGLVSNDGGECHERSSYTESQ